MTKPAGPHQPDYMAIINRVRAKTSADHAATYRAKIFNDAFDMHNSIESLAHNPSGANLQRVADDAQNIVTNYQMYLHHAKTEAGDD